MILKGFLSLANLLKAQVFSIHELLEVVVISEDKDLIFAAFQVVAASFKNLNNGQKLLIISFILYFYKDYLLRQKNPEYYWPILLVSSEKFEYL